MDRRARWTTVHRVAKNWTQLKWLSMHAQCMLTTMYLFLFALKYKQESSAFFIVQLSHPYMTTGKTTALTRWTFVSKVTSLLFNMLSRLVIAFLPRSKHLFISWLQSPSAVILESSKIKSLSFHCFPICLPWRDGTRCQDLSFFNVEF